MSPLHGSVLIEDGTIFGTAGRSSGARDGIHVFAIEPLTGDIIWDEAISDSSRNGSAILSDVLVSDNQFLYLRDQQIDPKTGKHQRIMRSLQRRGPGEVRSPARLERGPVRPVYLHSGWLNSLIDGSWRNALRSYHKGNQRRSYGDVFGQLIVFNQRFTYGFRSGYWSLGRMSPPHLFAARHTSIENDATIATTDNERKSWTADMPERSWVEAMVLAGDKLDKLYVAGPVDHEQRDTMGGFLWTVSATDGNVIDKIAIKSPCKLDGLAVARNRLYLSTATGEVLCFGVR